MKVKKYLRKWFLFLILLSVFRTSKGNDSTLFFNVKDFGAVGDGVQMDTKAIQKAIDKCAQAGGGTVAFPAGIYLSGSIDMHSNIRLNLDAGAVLKASPNLTDYTNFGRTTEGRNTSFIIGLGISNFAITGDGAIDGNDSAFIDWNIMYPDCCFDNAFTRQGQEGESYKSSFPDGPSNIKPEGRPGILIVLIESRNILIRGISIRNAPNWCLHLACCFNVNITGVNFKNSLLVPNADGVDVSNSKNVLISNCDIVAGDDGIAISPCADGFCKQVAENVHVSNCNITSRSAGIRIGWAKMDIRNCTFDNIVITSNRGICMNVRYDVTIENIIFSNIIINTRLHTGWWGVGEPIHMSVIPMKKGKGTDEQNIKSFGLIRNIRFYNVDIHSESGILLYGYNKNAIQDLYFDNIHQYFKNSSLNVTRGGNFELRPALDNKYAVFKHNIPAFYGKNLKNLNIFHYEVIPDVDLPPFYTNAIFLEDFEDIKIDGFRGTKLSNPPNYAAIYLENGSNATIVNCTAMPGTNVFLKQKNVRKEGFFMSNDLREARTAILPSANGFHKINNLTPEE